MPRNRALLTLRAVNSVNTDCGPKITASLIARSHETLMGRAAHAVTLADTTSTSADSFSAVTTTGGSVTVGGCDCANDADEARRTNKNTGRFRSIPTLCLLRNAARTTARAGGRFPGPAW